MAMDMDFRWMSKTYEDKARIDEMLAERQAYYRDEAARRKAEVERQLRMTDAQNKQDIYDASLGAKEYADRMAARSMGLQALPDTTFGQAQSALYGKMEDEAVRAAELQELAQLKAEREKRMNDPKLKMAAMLAMAGQPGAIQALLTNDLTKGGTKTQAQSDMDALEEKIVNDMFALAGADADTYSKITAGLLPLYRSKWDEIALQGGKSRMGSSWDEGWGKIMAELGRTRAKRKADADKKKNEKSTLRGL